MNGLDKFLLNVAPGVAKERMKNRAEALAYASYEASNTHPRNRDPRGQVRGAFGRDGESKAFPSWDRQACIQEISDLLRNDGGVLETLISRLADHVVGPGITPQARTENEAWNDEAEAYFRAACKRLDFENRQGMDFIGEGQKLLLWDAHIRGESFIRKLSGMQTQWFESELCKDPAAAGERVFQDGAHLAPGLGVVGYNFQTASLFDKTRSMADIYVPTDQLIHVHAPFKRSRQRRGVPVLAPVVPSMQQYLQTVDAMQEKVRNEADQHIKVFGKGEGGRVLNDMRFGEKPPEKDDQIKRVRTSAGMWWDLPDGRDMAAVETRTPSGEHLKYMDSKLQQYAAVMGIPYGVAFMMATGSYAATRGSFIQYRYTVERWWDYIVEPSQHLWNWIIADGIARKAIPPAPTKRMMNGLLRSDWDHVEWGRPHNITLAPLEDERVKDAAFGRGDLTLTAILKSKNQERKDVWDEREAELRDAINRAKQVEEDTGIPVDYTIFYNAARPGVGNPAAGSSRPKAEAVIEEDSE